MGTILPYSEGCGALCGERVGTESLDPEVIRPLVTPSGKKSTGCQEKPSDMSRVTTGQNFPSGRTGLRSISRHLLRAMRYVSVDISPGEDPLNYRKGPIYILFPHPA
jgi:hypothetical protein